MLLDKDIREPLFEYLEEQHDKVRILEEKTMGRSRAEAWRSKATLILTPDSADR